MLSEGPFGDHLPNPQKYGRWLANPESGEEVVISGIAGKLPESRNIYEYRDNLYNKVDMIVDDERRWNNSFEEYAKSGGKLYDIEKFDAGYFGIHKREAEIVNPMARLFLESAVEAIFDAGLNPKDLVGTKTGVVIGSCYGRPLNVPSKEEIKHMKDGFVNRITGYMVANKVSYYLKLNGPTIYADTSCSSSLFAIEHAFKAIRNGECDRVIVGGVNLCLYPHITVQLYKLGIVSGTGRCKVFDEAGDGAIRSEAIIAVLLEKAKNAKRVYAQILHAKTNCDGFKARGITFPSKENMMVLLEELYTEAGVEPKKLCYVEAHGTGTKAGDPQETEAIDRILCKGRQEPLWLGSVKSNMGHTEGSSGLSSIVKVIIGMENGFIPPNIHFKTPRQEIKSLIEGRLKVVTDKTQFVGDTIVAGINNFGVGGTNGHILIRWNEKKKNDNGIPQDNLPRLICVSGRTEDSITSILDDIKHRQIDAEYISLYHQIFRKNVENHLYRGYSIVCKSGEVIRSLQFFDPNKKSLYLVFTCFINSWRHIIRELLLLPLVTVSIQKIHDILLRYKINIMEILLNNIAPNIFNEIMGIMAVGIVLIDLIKTLNINPTLYTGYGLSQLIAGYFDGCLSVDEVVLTFYEIAIIFEKFEKENSNNNENDNISINDIWCLKTKSIADFKPQFLEKVNKIITNFKEKNDRWQLPSDTQILSSKLLVEAITCSKPCLIGSSNEECIILEIGDGVLLKLGKILSIYFNLKPNIEESYFLTILKTLGSLYEHGYNFELDKLYPAIEYPVSRSTPMISPLIKWNHKDDWFVPSPKNNRVANSNKDFIKTLSMQDETWQFINGHVVEGRILFPITGYLAFAWEAFANNNSVSVKDMNIVIKNFKIFRPTNLTPNTNIDFTVRIQKGSGSFEVLDEEALVANGIIYTPNTSNPELVLPNLSKDEEDLILEQDDVYRELLLRGYSYNGTFRQIMAANSNISKALIRWDGNWIIFLGKIIQLNVLKINTRLLLVPKEIQQISIDFKKHFAYVESFNEQEPNLPVYFYKELNIIRCGGIEIRGIEAVPIRKRKIRNKPVLETYTFIPNSNHSEFDLNSLLRINMQLALENLSDIKIKIVELYNKITWSNIQPIGPSIYNIFNDMPYVQPNITLLTKEEIQLDDITVKNADIKTENDCNFVIGINLLQKSWVLKEALSSLKKNGFILTRELLDYQFDNLQYINMQCLTEFRTENEKILLLRRRTESKVSISIKISNENLDWISELQEAIMKQNCNIIIYSQNEPFSGILGFINCIRSEPGGDKVRCVFIQDEAPTFDINNNFYKEQLKKDLVINVYQNGQWGTYRHLLLKNLSAVKKDHCYVSATESGDLSSLRWIQGPITNDNSLPIEKELIYVYYTAIGSTDVNSVIERPNLDPKEAIQKDSTFGIEFSGRDLIGRRYMGIVKDGGALSTIVLADKNLIWEIPSNWSLEDATTIPVAYSIVLYCFLHLHRLKSNQSVLIHSGDTDVGQAAINVALEFKCTAYTTVENEEKKHFLKTHFPQLNDEQIGRSNDTSFEQMILNKTHGHGVELILNGLTEETLPASLRCLAENGKFFQTNKTDSVDNELLNLELFKKGASFYNVLSEEFNNPKQIPLIKSLLNKALDDGLIKPLVRKVFKDTELETAFKNVNSNESYGKVLIEIRQAETLNLVNQEAIPQYLCNLNDTYIIVGGMGGLGLEFADWIIFRGARNLVLTSRRGLTNGYQSYRIKIWESIGCRVKISTADATTSEGCKQLIEEAQKLGPIVSIFNLAGIIKDGLFENQTTDNFMILFIPKLIITKYLDEISRKLCPNLRDFVVFSSICSGRGSIGVTNYGMANSIMERICERRRQDGFAAKAIQWGTIDDVGLITQLRDGDHKVDVGGSEPQKLSSCFQVLDLLLLSPNTIVSSTLIAEKQAKSSTSSKSIGEGVAQVLGIKDLKTISFESTLPEMGMDSMTASEINQMLKTDFNISMTLNELRSVTLAKLLEIQEKISSETESKTKNELNEVPSITDENNSTPHVLILPDIEGVATHLEPLIQNLKIKSLILEYPLDKDENNINDLVQNILPIVEENMSKTEKFNLVAYSFGVVVAIELASILESKGYLGHLICIDGSSTMLSEMVNKYVDFANEDQFQTSLLCQILKHFAPEQLISTKQDQILNCASFDQKLNCVAEIFSSNSISDFESFKTLANCLRKRLKYFVDYRQSFLKPLKSKVTLLKSSKLNSTSLRDDYDFDKLSENPVEVKKFNSNDKGIMENYEVAKIIDNLIDGNDNYFKIDQNQNINNFIKSDKLLLEKIR